ncbi:unnamed protein product [Lathyrus oleraceus]
MTQFLPIDPCSNALFDFAKDGVLLCKLINIDVPGTIDERAINTKQDLNPWEINENYTVSLNSATTHTCMSDLTSSLQKNWPTVACPSGDEIQFWTHEWEKHGTCYGSSLKQYDYF